VKVKAKATVEYETGEDGERRIQRVYYDAPIGTNPRVEMSQHIRYKYFTATDNPTLAGRLQRITYSVLTLSDKSGTITKISYELIYEGQRVVRMMERTGRTMVGRFTDAVSPNFLYRLTISNKVKRGFEPDARVMADVGDNKDGRVPIFVYTKL